MEDTRLMDIYRFVVKNGFYSVGREKFLDTDITHEEMKELVQLACQARGAKMDGMENSGRAEG
jgi:hypothetical protein